MEFSELVLKSRTYRRFYNGHAIETGVLESLVALVRHCPSASNMQPLKFIVSNTPGKNSLIYPHLTWAAYLKDWDGPAAAERPAGYIIILGDSELSKNILWDHSIAAQTINLGANEKGLGCCIIATIKKDSLREALKIPERYEILLVIAMGKPKEQVVMDEKGKDGEIKYWRDRDGVHHVPKRPVEELILKI